jgi:hypothetical protein
MTKAKGDEDTKHCGHCNKDLPIAEFYRNTARSDGLSGYCAKCQTAVNQEASKRLRDTVLAFLGGRCTNPDCRVPGGMDDPRALQVDHVNGGGTADRLVVGAGDVFLRAVLKAEPGKYQLLCANCNTIRRIEERQHIGARVYVREAPTKRTLLRQDPEWQKAHGELTRSYWAANPEQLAERNLKIKASRNGKGRKLTDADRAEVARLHSEGATQTALALQYGVSQALISKVVHA